MPGILSPCCDEVGDIIAPVAINRPFFQRPCSMPSRIYEQSTEAEQPHPDPPRVNVLRLAVKDEQTAIEVIIPDLLSLLRDQHLKQGTPLHTQIACGDEIIIIRLCIGILQKTQQGVCRGRGKCQENTIKFLKNFFQTFKFGKLWVLPWEPMMFCTINKCC